MSLYEWARENAIPLAVGGVGIVMMGVGIWQSVAFRMQQDERVLFSTPTSASPMPSGELLVVDVGGAVEKPGVYQMPDGSRINDALMKAGGLGSNADREYVSRSINLADKLRDGAKIYIPNKDDPINTEVIGQHPPNGEAGAVGDRVGQNSVIHINTATMSELDTLWGVGQARAQQIIENRPYNSVDELTSRAKVPQSVVDHNAGIIQL